LRAGSAVTLHLSNPPAEWEAKLAAAEQTGIGLRREEGFGRIAFNHPVYARCSGVLSDFGPTAWLNAQSPGHVLDLEIEQRKRWQERVSGLDFSRYLSNERACTAFSALAGWLYAQRSASPETIIRRMVTEDVYGAPSWSLKETIGGQQEYGARSKDSFFLKDGTKGREIAQLLQVLNDEYPSHFWPVGIAMVADQIASAIAEKRQK
jgi:CRISPR-associated protein Csx10